MLHEARIDAKKQQMMLLLVMGAPSIRDSSDRRNWNEQSKKVFSQYINLIMGIEVSEEEEKESMMLEFYEKIVKQTKPIMSKSKDGKLSVTGVSTIFGGS